MSFCVFPISYFPHNPCLSPSHPRTLPQLVSVYKKFPMTANPELPADDDKQELARRQALTEEWQLPALASVDDICMTVAQLCQQAGLCPHSLLRGNDVQSPRPAVTNSSLNANISSDYNGRNNDNTNTVATQLTSSNTISPSSYELRVSSALSACDVYSLSGRAAAATISVIGEERLSLSVKTSDLEFAISNHDLEVQRLRTRLRREVLIVEYRKELESLAKQIIKYPSLTQLSEDLSCALATSASIDAQIDVLDQARTKIAKELALLSRAAHAVIESTQHVAQLVSEQEQHNLQTDSPAPNPVSNVGHENPASAPNPQPGDLPPAPTVPSETDVPASTNHMDTS